MIKEDVETFTLGLTSPMMGVIAEPDSSTVFIIDESGKNNKTNRAKYRPAVHCGKFYHFLGFLPFDLSRLFL